MPSKTEPTWFNPEVAAYVADHTAPPDDVLSALIERTREVTGDRAIMQVSPSQGALLTLLTRVVGAKRALEIGTFTGYSSICIARGLTEGGHLMCCDVSEEYTSIARQAWVDASVDDRIELRIAPALETIAALPADSEFDLVFIDADKEGYPAYLDWATDNLRPGGIVLLDNAFLFGTLAEPATGDRAAQIRAMQSVHEMLGRSGRFRATVLPTGEGLAFGVRI
jgi:caffeoyl-CoA O-methyltransferase